MYVQNIYDNCFPVTARERPMMDKNPPLLHMSSPYKLPTNTAPVYTVSTHASKLEPGPAWPTPERNSFPAGGVLCIWHIQSVTRSRFLFPSRELMIKVRKWMGGEPWSNCWTWEENPDLITGSGGWKWPDGTPDIEDKRERRTEGGDSCLSYAGVQKS